VCHLGHPGRAPMGASCAGQPDIFWEEWLEAVSRGAAFRGTIEAHSAAEIQHGIQISNFLEFIQCNKTGKKIAHKSGNLF
jgi:hypothetical protein